MKRNREGCSVSSDSVRMHEPRICLPATRDRAADVNQLVSYAWVLQRRKASVR